MDNRYNIIYNHYIKNIEKNGLEDYQILDWESKDAQESRFEIFVDNFGLCIKNKSVLDIGSGLGNFAQYLDKLDEKIIYTGIDILKEMVALSAKKKFKNIDANFFDRDIFYKDNICNASSDKKYNYIYSSGIFNLDMGCNLDFLDNAIKKFFELAVDGICFNLLDKKSENTFGPKYFYYDQDDVLNKIKNTYSSRLKHISIVDSYSQNDFSIVCFLK